MKTALHALGLILLLSACRADDGAVAPRKAAQAPPPALARAAMPAAPVVAPPLPVPTVEASPDEIRLGLSAPLSGPAHFLGQHMKQGIELYLRRVNEAGGIHGRRLRLIALDDSYVPAMAEANARRLIEREKVLALIGNVGTPTAAVTLPLANRTGTPLFGAMTGAEILRKTPPDRYVLNYRASYAEETANVVKGLLEIGIHPYEIAFFTQDDSYGDSGYQGAVAALRAAGFRDIDQLAHGRYKRNTVDIEDGLMTVLSAEVEPKAIILVGAYVPCARFIRLARRVLPQTLYINLSFVGSQSLAAELGEAGEGVIVTQVVPHFDSGLPITRDYLRDLELYGQGARPGFIPLEGYIAARVLTEGLRRAGDSPTRESLVQAIQGLGTIDIGLGVPVTFGPRDHQGSDAVWPTVLRGGRFEPLRWSDLRPAL
jgi:branched-chain amino acid transport system substrate-binding protein